ncbi:rod shape-determining protein MreC [Kiloniella sp. b19]|uniref:rod shape-determining protein MreC n=1 Tax=Kiloniella sp. GXU_MW_B19 TaxID=3141326 RepID=UPI0031E46AB9
MNKRVGSFNFAETPLRAWLQRFAFLILLLFSIVLIALTKVGNPSLMAVRVAIVDSVTPVMEGLSRPVIVFNDAIETAQNYVALKSENAELRRQNEALRSWQIAAARLEGENEALRTLLNMSGDAAPRSVAARVVADQGGSFVRSVVVSAGQNDGVRKGQIAMTGHGLAGRVSEVGRSSSRVVLITDISSRIPVLVGTERHRAILAGDNSPAPGLRHLDRTVSLRKGDLVYTSGHGGVFEPGLPIGTVSGIVNGIIRVKPFAEWDKMDFLRIEDYGLALRLDVLNPAVERQNQVSSAE